jgi:hypothetical protein
VLDGNGGPAEELQTHTMKKLLQAFSVLFTLAGVLLVSQRPAYAYVDPGSGLLAVQVIGASLVSAGWFLRRKINALLRWSAKAKQQPEESLVAKEGEPLA